MESGYSSKRVMNTMAVTAMAFLMSAVQASAATVETEATAELGTEQAGVAFSGRVSVGYLTGEAHELVYWPHRGGHKASELTWDIDSLYMVGLGATVQARQWLTINIDTWFNLGDGSGYMEDYDWATPGMDWTDQSTHDDTDVTKGFLFDVNAELTAFSTNQVQLTGIVGFRRDNFEWESRGGSYVYSVNGFRDMAGTFPADELGITYEQTFNVPYIGIGFKGDFDRIHFAAKITGSVFVNGEAVDHHHLRNLVTTDDFSNESMIAFDVSFGYDISDNIGLEVAYAYEKYDTMTGDSVWDFNNEGVSIGYADSAGAELETSMVSMNITYSF
jgi:plasminogen activator